jgi:hypothetical protein
MSLVSSDEAIAECFMIWFNEGKPFLLDGKRSKIAPTLKKESDCSAQAKSTRGSKM